MELWGLILATLVAPAILNYGLRRTRMWAATGLALAGFAVYLFATLDHGDHHGDSGMGAWYEIGNLIQVAYGVFMLLYAGVLLALARIGRKAALKPPPIAPARIVSDQSASS